MTPSVTPWNLTGWMAQEASAISETNWAMTPDQVDELGEVGGLPRESAVADAIHTRG